MRSADGRETALKALLEYGKKSGKADEALNGAVSRLKPETREKALATRIFYGVIQNFYLLDYYIGSFSSLKLNKISPAVLEILRVGLYQLLFLDRVPKSAVVDTSVNLAKRAANPRAASFVNAVLRKAASVEMPEINAADRASYLSVKYSHPLWLVKRFLSLFGDSETEKLLKIDNAPAPAVFRVNTLKCTADEAVNLLISEGVPVKKHPIAENCLFAENIGDPYALKTLKDGLLYVQDASSQLSIAALHPEPGWTVLDLCSAPGGKSALCAQYMKNKGVIRSFDISPKKAQMIKETAERLGASIIEAGVSDALRYNKDLFGYADCVICDVPCSGLGVIRKKPDIRYKSENEISLLPEIQKKILENGSNYVKDGGVLLYSTCTVLPEENEKIVNAFLEEHPDFSLLERKLLLPQVNDTDGFFFAKLRKAGG
ncbi:MAG: 16S rRNA (cytosine(967)-C(5))-methyltransferase RsmB [Bacillota bacterium]|nr:16S rRNA (cytosine(967)-C(5))-methyltransferase RsmB [Bacillota bacterium]